MKTLGFGAIVWDNIPPADTAGRTSDAKNLGGAVLNVLVHLHRMGNQTEMISALGQDPLGDEAYKVIDQMGISTQWIGQVAAPTTLVRVEFDEAGEPSYKIDDDVSWDHIVLNASDVSVIGDEKFDIFCFGTIEQRSSRSRESLKLLLENIRFDCVFLDVNLRPPFYTKEAIEYSLQHCTIAKLNVDEADVLDKMFGLNAPDLEALAKQLRDLFDIEHICVTHGSRGAYYSSPTAFGFCPAYSVTVADTVGAGDAFSAGLLHCLQNGDSFKSACDFACRMGAIVASRTSSIPHYTLAEVKALKRTCGDRES